MSAAAMSKPVRWNPTPERQVDRPESADPKAHRAGVLDIILPKLAVVNEKIDRERIAGGVGSIYYCCGQVMVNPAWHRVVPCHNRAKMWHEHKPYCGVHDPVRVKAADDKRRALRNAKYERETEINNERWAWGSKGRGLLLLAKEVVHNRSYPNQLADVIVKLTAYIKKAEAE